MAVNTSAKHSRGHQDFAAACRKLGFSAVQCSHGRLDCRNLPGIHISIRRTERLRMENAMEEAAAAAEGLPSVLAHRSNGHPWRITMDLETFFLLYRAFIQKLPGDPGSPASEPYHGSDPTPDHCPAERPDSSASAPSPVPKEASPPFSDTV